MRMPSLVILALMVLIPAVAGGAEDGGSRSIFAYGAGNRALGMGGAYGAVADDASAPLWNPGGIGLIAKKQLMATRVSFYGLGMNEEFVGFAVPSWRWGVLAGTFRHFGVGGIDGRDDRNFATEELAVNESQITLSYGKRLAEAWSLGATIKLQSQSLGDRSAAGVGMDAGLLAFPGVALGSDAMWSRRIAVGVALRNLVEPSLKLDQETVKDPLATRLGASYRHPLGNGGQYFLAAVDLERTREASTDVFAGFEVRVHPMLLMRTGLSQGAPTVGTRIQWRDLALDYAYENNDLGSLHRFGVSLGLGATVEESRLAALHAQNEAMEARLSEAFAQSQRQQSLDLLDQAEAACSRGAYDEALDFLTVVSILSPDLEGAARLEVRCLLAKAAARENAQEFAEAVMIFGRVLVLEPENESASEGMRRCRAESDRRANRSAEIQGRFAEGLDAFGAGDLVTARRHFQQILTTEDDPETARMLERTEQAVERRVAELTNQARRFLRNGILKDAETALNEADRLLPGSAPVARAQADLARTRSLQSRPDSTKADSPSSSPEEKKRSLTVEQQREVETLYKNGLAAMEGGRTRDAVRYWEWAFSLDPNYLQLREYLKQEYLLQGMEAFSEGRWDDAVGIWEAALEVDPTDEKTHVYLTRARKHLSRTREILGTSGQ